MAAAVFALLPPCLGGSALAADEAASPAEFCSSAEAMQLVSVANAVREALEHQPELLLAQEDVEISRAGAKAALTPFFPNMQAIIDGDRYLPDDGGAPVRVVGNNVIGGPQSFSTYASINFNWNLFSSGRDLAGYRGAKADVRASEATLEDRRADALLGALEAYTQLYGAQVLALQGGREARLLEEMKARAEERYRNGHGSAVDVGRASSAALDGKRTLYRACRGLSDKSTALSQAIGTRLPRDRIFRVGSAPPPVSPANAEDATDVESILQDDPSVVAAREKVASAQQNVKRARASFGPTVALIGRRDYLGQEPNGLDAATNHLGPSSYRFGLSIAQPLFPTTSESAELSRARAELRKAELAEETALFEADARMRDARSALEEARASHEAARGTLVDALNVRTLTESLYRAGRVSLDEVQQAQITVERAQADVDVLGAQSVLAGWALQRARQPAEFVNMALRRLQELEDGQ